MSPLSMESAVRLRLAGGFFLGSLAEPEGMGVLFSEFEEEEGREGWCVTGGRAFIAGGGAGAMGGRSEDEEGCIAGDIGVRAEGGRGEGASGHERARTFGNGGGEGRERDWTTHVGLAGKDAGDDLRPASPLFGASPAARLLFAVQGARTRNHRGISPRYVTRFPPAPRHASASIGPPRVLCMRCCRLACRSLLRPPPAPFHSQLAASSWPGKHISSDPIGTNPAITVRSGMLPARALIAQLSRAIGRESAETELRWMKQTLSDPPPGIRPSCRSLEEMVARRVAGEPLQYILGEHNESGSTLIMSYAAYISIAVLVVHGYLSGCE